MTAKHARRRIPRLAIAALIVVAALWLGWCGRGWFRDGDGDSGSEPRGQAASSTPDALAPAAPAPPAPCRLRIDATGVQVDGAAVSIPDAVDRCRTAGRAEIVITGNARYGVVTELEHALDDAGIEWVAPRRPQRPKPAPGPAAPLSPP